MIINPYLVQPSGPSYGTLTTAWIAATGETDLTILGALNTLESDLTTYGLTAKMKALYPFVGGTATKHKFNFMDARDLDAAFRLVFNGGLTHDSNGIKGNGTNGYYDTKLNPSTQFSLSTGGCGFVATNENIQTGVDFGAFESGVNYRFYLGVRDTGDSLGAAALSNALYSTTNTNSSGFFGITRPANDNTNFYTIINTNNYATADSYYEPNSVITGFAFNINNGSIITAYSNRRQSFACFGEGLTTTQAQNLRTAVNTFNTTLGR